MQMTNSVVLDISQLQFVNDFLKSASLNVFRILTILIY